MAKLYIFGIGGTGSRVIKALTFLLASGVKPHADFDTIIPMVIDPDAANGDLNRTTDILNKYQHIQKNSNEPENLFGTKIKTLKELLNENHQNISSNFIYSLAHTGQKFGEFIDYNGMDDDNKALFDLLFSQENKEADMTVGFKGNPNIGSVVLNTFSSTNEDKEFRNSFNPGDAIFIINSIFGGTGASGFPLLIKNLRLDDSAVLNSQIISQAPIGAITYLPYFSIPESAGGNKDIDSSTFMSKSKAALSYYEHAIFKDEHSLNAFYYLGDFSNNSIPYAEGKENQKNPAHFLELAGALAIIDFTNNHCKQSNGATVMKEFGTLQNNGKSLKYNLLGSKTKDSIKHPLSALTLFSLFLEHSLGQLKVNKGPFNNQKDGIDNSFYTKDFYKEYLEKFVAYFTEWLNEMEKNDVSFAPFHTNVTHETLKGFVKDLNNKEGILGKIGIKKQLSGNNLIADLNGAIKSKKYDSEESNARFIKVFDDVIQKNIKQLMN